MSCPTCGGNIIDVMPKPKKPSPRELRCAVDVDEITRQISASFDYQFNGTSRFSVPAMPPVPSSYRIGLIVGPSGSGKSTLLREFGAEREIAWQRNKAVASHFQDADTAGEMLSAVGLNSIPAWLRPFHVLSTGEQFRADLARRIEDGACIDEFTSVVDRQVARSCAYALRRHADAKPVSRITIASCHYDIIEWLQPDWYLDTANMEFVARGSLQRRPTIKVSLNPCSSEAWTLFRDHHYLSADINRASRCWLAEWDGRPVGFASVLAMPHIKNAWREHRTVVLPDFQGLGIGVRLSDAVGEIFKAQGLRFFSKTAHPRMGRYRDQSPKWRATSKNHSNRRDYLPERETKEKGYRLAHAHRWCFSHEYVGVQ
jgi:GNAT superfamily N-acetyltransferase/thymidylate kinase